MRLEKKKKKKVIRQKQIEGGNEDEVTGIMRNTTSLGKTLRIQIFSIQTARHTNCQVYKLQVTNNKRMRTPHRPALPENCVNTLPVCLRPELLDTHPANR